MPSKTLQIRNSTAEFLIFTKQAGENGIEVRVQDGTIWLSQKFMAALFDCTPENITMHLKNIFAEGELNEISVTKDLLVTAADGKNYKTKHYNLDAIIAVEGSAASSFQITWETIRAPVTPALSLGILSATSRLRIFALLGRYMLTM